jgi:hypothetical protein
VCFKEIPFCRQYVKAYNIASKEAILCMSYVPPLGTHTCVYAEYSLYRRLSTYACNKFSCIMSIWELLLLEQANVLDMSPFSNVNFTNNTRVEEHRVFKIGVGRCLVGVRYGNRKYLSRGNSSQKCRWCLFLLIWLYLSLSHTHIHTHTHTRAHTHTNTHARTHARARAHTNCSVF